MTAAAVAAELCQNRHDVRFEIDVGGLKFRTQSEHAANQQNNGERDWAGREAGSSAGHTVSPHVA